MEIFLNLKRQWSTVRSAEQNERFYDANFSDDEMDIFYNHLNEIDHVHQLDPYTPEKAQIALDNSPHIDPRTGHESRRFIIDATFQFRPKLHASFNRQSRLPVGQHLNGIRAMQIIAHRRTGSTESLSRRDEDILKMHTNTEALRLAEHQEFIGYTREWFAANVVRMISNDWKPFFWNRIADEWQRAAQQVHTRYADRSYGILTAIPLDNEPQPTDAVFGEVVNGIDDLPKYTAVLPFTDRVMGGPVPPIWLLPETGQSAQLPDGAVVCLSVSVIRQLIDYPMNSTTSWLIPFEIRPIGDDSGNNCCVFDELLPDSLLSVKRRMHLALQQELLASGVSLQSSAKDQDQVDSDKLRVDVNMTYNLMRIDIDERPASMPPQQQSNIVTVTLDNHTGNPICLAVKTNVDGSDTETDGTDGQQRFIHVTTKPEYQANFGAEEMTQSELIDEWCKLAFYPNSFVDRYRVNVENSTVLRMDRLTRADVETEMYRLYDLKGEHLLSRLNAILHILLRFPCQQYLMRHSCKPDRTVRIYGQRATTADPAATLSLQQMLAEETAAITTADTVPWTNIDRTLLTEMHLRSNTLPCMFPHQKPIRAINKKTHRLAQPQNDRQMLVARANRKTADAAAVLKAGEAQRKRGKRLRKRTKQQMEKEQKQIAASAEYEDYDANPHLSRNPMDADDESTATNCGKSWQTTGRGRPRTGRGRGRGQL